MRTPKPGGNLIQLQGSTSPMLKWHNVDADRREMEEAKNINQIRHPQ